MSLFKIAHLDGPCSKVKGNYHYCTAWNIRDSVLVRHPIILEHDDPDIGMKFRMSCFSVVCALLSSDIEFKSEEKNA